MISSINTKSLIYAIYKAKRKERIHFFYNGVFKKQRIYSNIKKTGGNNNFKISGFF